MKIKNFTPHQINMLGDVKKTFSSVGIARVSTTSLTADVVDGIEIMETVWGDTVDLPMQSKDTILIVSRMVMAANPSRLDLVAPNDLVRDEQGRVIGARSLSK